MHELADVHRHDDLGLAGVGQDVARVLGGNAGLHKLVISLPARLDSLVEGLGGLGVGVDACRAHNGRLFLEFDVTLRLLVVARKTMAHKLMGERAAHALNGKRVAGMLKRGEVTACHDGGENLANLLVGQALHELAATHGGIAKAGSSRHGALGFRRVVEKRNVHGILPILRYEKSRPLGMTRRAGLRACWCLAWQRLKATRPREPRRRRQEPRRGRWREQRRTQRHAWPSRRPSSRAQS